MIELGQVVRDALHRAAAFFNGFLGPLKVEQTKMCQTRGHDEVGWLPCHAAARNPHLHDAVMDLLRKPSRRDLLCAVPRHITPSGREAILG